MFKNLSSVLVASLLVVGCGGGGGGGGGGSNSSPASSAISSVASSSTSSVVATSSKASSSSIVASSSSVKSSSSNVSTSASSQSGVVVLDATKWVVNEFGRANLTLTSDGPNVSILADYGGAKYILGVPTPVVEQGTVEVNVVVSSEFKASGAGLQIFAFIDAAPWEKNKNDCPIVANSSLVVGAQTVTCVLDAGGIFNQTIAPVGLGIQAIAGVQGETKLPVSGTVLISSARVLLATNVSSSSVSSVASSSSSSTSSARIINLPASSWYAKGDGSVKNGDVYTISKPYAGVGYWLNAADAVIDGATIEGATVEVNFVVNNDFKTSGVGLKINAGIEVAPDYPGKNDCPQLNSAALTPGVTQRISCVLSSGGIFNQKINPVEVRLLSEGVNAANGTLTIQSGRIILAP